MKFSFTVVAIIFFIVQNIQNKAKPKFNLTEPADLKSNGENKTITPDVADVLSKEAEAYLKEIEKSNPGIKLVEGDMLLNRQQQKTYGNKLSNGDYEAKMDQALIAAQWPNNRMYYTFDRTVSYRFRKYIRRALAELRQKLVGCVKIVEGVGVNYVTVSANRNRQCVSMVGVNRAWRNTINLDDTRCWYKGVIQHEFIHSLGIFHHQTRKDRDKYIRINWKNIITKPKDMSHNFRKQEKARTYNLPYDYRSIMHYGGTFFSKRKFGPNKLLTIKTRNPKYQKVIGRQDHISNGDIRLIKSYYGCKKDNKAKQVSCGGHSADSCSKCGANKSYCNGHCKWNGLKCTKAKQVSCGGHSANSCSECGPNKSYCNGNCKWNGVKCTEAKQVSCGGHSAYSCSDCGANKSYCNGNCKWNGVKCTEGWHTERKHRAHMLS